MIRHNEELVVELADVPVESCEKLLARAAPNPFCSFHTTAQATTDDRTTGQVV